MGGQWHVRSATLFYFSHKKVKQNLYSFHVFLVNVIEELQHSEKQMFGSKKNIDIQHR